MTENQLDIPLNQTQGEKKPVTLLFRYWFGPGDTTYIETVGSDGNSYGFNSLPKESPSFRLGRNWALP